MIAAAGLLSDISDQSAVPLLFHLHLFITCSPHGLLGVVLVSLPLCLHIEASDSTFLFALRSSA